MVVERRSVTINGELQELEGNLNVLELLQRMGLYEQRGVAVAINHEIVPKSTWPERAIEDSDAIEILHAAQGG